MKYKKWGNFYNLLRGAAYILYIYIGRNTIFRTMINSQKNFEKIVKKYLQSLHTCCIIILAVTLIA